MLQPRALRWEDMGRALLLELRRQELSYRLLLLGCSDEAERTCVQLVVTLAALITDLDGFCVLGRERVGVALLAS